MYAVIRSGGKQYRVAPGDVIRVERTPADGGQVVFDDILAVSGSEGQIARHHGSDRDRTRLLGAQLHADGLWQTPCHDKLVWQTPPRACGPV